MPWPQDQTEKLGILAAPRGLARKSHVKAEATRSLRARKLLKQTLRRLVSWLAARQKVRLKRRAVKDSD